MRKDKWALALEIAGTTIVPGTKPTISLAVSRLPTHTPVELPLIVAHGRHTGPTLWLSAAIHGDELNGIAIIREVMEQVNPLRLRGTVIAVPVVNVFGLIGQSRYLPDRRDLNRSFPGSAKGSLASRLAWLFMTEVVDRCTHGIDLHTGALHRGNYPQIRADVSDPETLSMAKAFGAPIIINAKNRPGSLRAEAKRKGLPVLLFEGGEGLRFDRDAIKHGVRGVLSVMAYLGMRERKRATVLPQFSAKTSWVRAKQAGLFMPAVKLGQAVTNKAILGRVTDIYGDETHVIRSAFDGMVIGCTNNPIVHRGDPLVNLARLSALP